MAKIGLPKESGKRLKVREKSVKSQGILKWILSGNPVYKESIKIKTVHTGQCFNRPNTSVFATGPLQLHEQACDLYR